MKTVSLLPLACAALLPLAAAAAGSDALYDAFKGRIKAGMYEYKMDVDMGAIPGMPPGMGKQTHTIQHCVTPEDIQRGEVNRNDRNRMPKDCDVKDLKVSGNTATYKMVCTGEHSLTSDNKLTFQSDGFTSDVDMTMSERGRPMTMKQHMQARYLGPSCTK
jgi:hypothetical protein